MSPFGDPPSLPGGDVLYGLPLHKKYLCKVDELVIVVGINYKNLEEPQTNPQYFQDFAMENVEFYPPSFSRV